MTGSHSPEQIARVCHETIRAIQVVTGDPLPSPPWESADQEARDSTIASVNAVLEGADAEELHAVWCRGKAAAGWRRGEFKDPAARIHPDLVPFAELPWSAQVKDRVFVAIVREMSGEPHACGPLLERAQTALAFERERAEAAETMLAALAGTAGAAVTAAVGAERERIRKLAVRTWGASHFFLGILTEPCGDHRD